MKLVDISQAELEKAELHAEEAGVILAAISCAGAKDLRGLPRLFKEDFYDVVLCQGLLYRLLPKTSVSMFALLYGSN